MAEIKRLTGKDGKVFLADKSAVITGDGTTTLTKGHIYVALTTVVSSGFPSGITIGIPFVGDGTSKPKATETYIDLTLTPQCDITSASVEFNKAEIDITTLCDTIMKYATGMTEATGTLEGITTLGKSEAFIAKFVTVQVQNTVGVATTTPLNDDVVIVGLELNKADNSDADVAYFFAPVVLNSFNLGATINEAQTFTAEFRIAQDNEIIPAFIEADKALFS